jgi:thiamine-phosphate pyrophosphorylase
MRAAKKISGLYALTPGWTDSARLLAAVRGALAGGARVVQFRRKGIDKDAARRQASELLALCREFGASLIINDNVELARDIDADGVHIGIDDAPLAQARSRLGPDKIIGVSCYDSLPRALDAEAQGADYVAFGSFFPSATKPHAVVASLPLLTEAKRKLTVPVVAIGGITPGNAPRLIEAGADAIAVITALFDGTDTRATARTFGQLFEQASSNPNLSVHAS